MDETKNDSPVTAGKSKEAPLTPEQRIAEVVSRADSVFIRRGMPREPDERQMICGMASDLVSRAADRKGLRNHKYQLRGIHKALGISDPENALRHGMNIVWIEDEAYLIDISFVQFMDPKTGTINQGEDDWRGTGIKYAENPLAQELIKKGYFKLSDETLREYLNISSEASDKSHIQSATVEKLQSLNPKVIVRNFEHEIPYMDKLLDGAT